MLTIRTVTEAEFNNVRDFYYELIDMMKDARYKPAWEKGVYPADDYLFQSIRNRELYIGMWDGHIVAAMIVNHENNEGYKNVKWGVDATAEEVTIIHALGVLPTFKGKGFAKEMVKEVISMARENHQKAIRLDVLSGNLPAEKLYAGLSFRYIETVNMFYEDTGWTDFLLYEYLM